MKDFPQELVDEVIGRLFDIVEKDNRWQGSSRRFCPGWHGISRYSLVSRAWVSPTQKHHFNHLHLDSPSATNRWRVRIPFDPTGVSRHVRKLVLGDLDLSDFEGFEAYMRAFIQVESLTVIDCTGVSLYVTMEWFLPMKSSMVELQVGELSATPLTITSLLAALPLLNCVEIYELRQSDNETTPPATTRIPFFEGANRLTLCSFDNRSCPEGLLDWIPPSARFGHLDIDTECALHHPDLVNQWLASSCETLTNLTIRWGEPCMCRPK
ncbi:hypothetical protein BDM02DRAFT_829114 [Thelephora ganbajun]|uniref:Uncharacterized protein n=1 Tax=Thelephora ganbajun TaxID=370292 RepID=A0ACB6Z5C1_THEGA|nr:hypothetical protein BDM02DRAFT_829114 [Thelephora ganbajun]